MSGEIIVPVGGKYELPPRAPNRLPFTPADLEARKKGTLLWYVFGYIKYDDLREVSRIQGFCFIFEAMRGERDSFFPTCDPAYQYDRKIEKP